jgi:octaprenyl-diphosphate synthase
MTELDRFLREQIDTFEPEIREMAGYCVDTTGKRIRPILVFLSGWRNSAQPSPEFLRLAAVVELVHLATLVHDDIMDEAEVRRGRLTATRAYGPVAAVLLGDALFSHALFLASQFPLTDVCRAVSESTRKVCAGEIIQTMRRRSIDITEVDYRRIIDLKTAELFRVSCMLGTRLAGYPETYVEAASHFGRHLGIAYQVYDDLADYVGEEKRLGKTLGTDLVSGKLTLPLLLLMERLSESERAELLAEIRGQSPVRLSLHLEQMQKHGVFRLVAEAVEAEILAASKALADWSEFPSTGLLLSLCGMLREQLAALWPPARV